MSQLTTDPIPDIQPSPVRNVPSETRVTRLSQQVSDLEATVARLRRRLALERAVVGLVVLAGAGAWALPQWMPGAWALSINGRPVAAMRDRSAAEAVLSRVKAQGSESAASHAVLQKVQITRANPADVQVTDAATAQQRLSAALATHADRGVIYVDGTPVVALPDATQAGELLEQLKQQAAGRLEELEAAPQFKEQVEVRTEPAPQDLWADRETALGLLSGQDSGGTHTVRSGENAWMIAQRSKVTLKDLERLNPGVDLQRLQTGQKLVVGKAAEPVVTVMATGELTEVLPTPFRTLTTPRPLMWVGKRVRKQAGIPGRERVTYRVTFENGKAVRRDILERQVVQPARDQIIAVGTKPRR